jgi:hypothetical protein
VLLITTLRTYFSKPFLILFFSLKYVFKKLFSQCAKIFNSFKFIIDSEILVKILSVSDLMPIR